MIRINYLWPWEKRRIVKKISKQIEKEYRKKVKNVNWNYTGDTECSLYVYLEDGKELYVRFDIKIGKILTILDDLSF